MKTFINAIRLGVMSHGTHIRYFGTSYKFPPFPRYELRTPIRDPAEIEFLVLLIASSIGMATGYFLAIGVLFAVVFIALAIQWFIHNRITRVGNGYLMISVDQSLFSTLESKLNNFLGTRLQRLNLEIMYTLDKRVGLHYQYRRESSFDWAGFTNELNQLAGTAKLEVFIG